MIFLGWMVVSLIVTAMHTMVKQGQEFIKHKDKQIVFSYNLKVLLSHVIYSNHLSLVEDLMSSPY